MGPIYDALDIIADSGFSKRPKSHLPKTKPKDREENVVYSSGRDLLEKFERIKVEPLMFIRGRSIHRQYFLIDEAQNLEPAELKTILTRAGENTKIILAGDIYQIDTPHLDSMSNGLTYVIGKFKGHSLAAHISLNRGVRSDLATLAAQIL